MARPSVMIPIESDLLRKVVLDKCGTITALEQPLGVSKQAIGAWLSNGRIPPSKLDVLADMLDLDEQTLLKITKRRVQSAVLFRTTRNVAVAEENRAIAFQVARDFFVLDRVPGEQKKDVSVAIKTKDPAALADAILTRLQIAREQLSLGALMRALENNSIHVLFVDFSVLFIHDKEKKQREIRAFSVREGHRYAIVIDGNELIEDVIWIICHELAHIFSGDLDDEEIIVRGVDSKETEEFCNRTAVEIVTPGYFFSENREELVAALDCRLKVLPYLVDQIASHLGSSFSGVIQALEEHKLISREQKSYLWGVHHNRQKLKLQPTVMGSVGCERLETLDQALNNPDLQKFLKLQNVLRRALVDERVSFRRAGELFGVNEMAVRDMMKRWEAQNKNDSAETAN